MFMHKKQQIINKKFNLTLIAVKQATIMLWEVVFLDFYKLYLLLNRFVLILVLYSLDLGMYNFLYEWLNHHF